jgi:hypothetical protein
VTLTAGGGNFLGWSGCDAVSGTSCTVTLGSPGRAVTATFDNPSGLTVTVVRMEGVSGTVSGPGISCPGDCTETYAPGTVVTLTVTAGEGDFLGWSGCDAVSRFSCTVTLTAARTVTATFDNPWDY